MRKLDLIFTICIILNITNDVKAQIKSTIELNHINTFVNKWNHLKSISYDAEETDRSPFTGDTSKTINSYELIFDNSQNVLASKSYIKGEGYEQTTLYNGEKIYHVYNDNTYDISKNNKVNINIFGKSGVIDSIAYYLQNNPNKIVLLNDTVVNKVDCYQFKFVPLDSTESKDKTFIHYYFVFDKNSFTPQFYGNYVRTELSAKGYSVGICDFFSFVLFKNVKKDLSEFDLNNFVPPAQYQIAKKRELLKKGENNPVWEAKDLNGNNYNSSSFIGRNTLLFLTSTGCIANQLSIKSINNLVNKYSKEKLQIISAYSENVSQVKKYTDNNQLDFPIIPNATQIQELYNASGSPYFYLIDKNGKVFFSRVGYSGNLEEELVKNIEKMLQY